MDVEEAEAMLRREERRLAELSQETVLEFFHRMKRWLPTLAFVHKEGKISLRKGLVISTAVMKRRERLPVTAERVLQVVAENYRIDVEELKSSRKHSRAAARKIVYFLLWEKVGLSFSAIGRFLQRNHTSVRSGVMQLKEQLETDQELEWEVRALTQLLADEVETEDELTAIVLTDEGIFAYPARYEKGRKLLLQREFGHTESLYWIRYGPQALQMIDQLVRERAELGAELRPWRDSGPASGS
jgi:hypothetical protein